MKEIIIRTGLTVRGQNRGHVPHVETALDRYDSYKQKITRLNNAVPVNNFPWKWKEEKNVD